MEVMFLKEENSFQKNNINWLACIYDDYRLNPYIMAVCVN